MGEGNNNAETQIVDVSRLVRHIRILLDYLQRQPDLCLRTKFPQSDLGQSAEVTYSKFLNELIEIETKGAADPSKLDVSDKTFLLESRDFLAACAAPATMETISITQEYIDARAGWATTTWTEWGKAWAKWIKERLGVRPDNEGRKANDPNMSIDRRFLVDSQFEKPARWLAKSVWWLERFTVVFTILTIVISAHAMIGNQIIAQEKAALDKFLTASSVEDQAELRLLKTLGLPNKVDPARVDADYVDQAYCLSSGSISTAPNPSSGAAPPVIARAYTLATDPAPIANSVPAGAPSAPARSALASESAESIELRLDVAEKCRQLRWALSELVGENVRLRSWEAPFIDTYSIWTFPIMTWRRPHLLRRASMQEFVGWDDPIIHEVGSDLKPQLCQALADAYHYQLPRKNVEGCPRVLRYLARDSHSLGNSILAWLTMYILPALYALIGSACATMITIRRKTEETRLSYTDRGRVTYNLVFGIIFGAVIGMLADHLASPSGMDKLGLSALAFLAGYNTPAMFDFLTELSNRVFGQQSQMTQSPAALPGGVINTTPPRKQQPG